MSYGSLRAILDGKFSGAGTDASRSGSKSSAAFARALEGAGVHAAGTGGLANLSEDRPYLAKTMSKSSGHKSDSLDNLSQSTYLGSASRAERRFASTLLTPLLVALAELHSRGLIHRDIRPENVFFTRQGHVVLGGLHAAIEKSVERPVSQVSPGGGRGSHNGTGPLPLSFPFFWGLEIGRAMPCAECPLVFLPSRSAEWTLWHRRC